MPQFKKPELIIDDELDGSPTRGHCSFCPQVFQVGGLSTENERKLNELFQQHIRETHPQTLGFSEAVN